MLEINNLLVNATGRKKQILKRLKELNHEAYEHMLQMHMIFKTKYQVLQTLACWKEAKELLIEYKNDYQCAVCKSETCNDFVMHHDKYDKAEVFTPTYIQFIHKHCHRKVHRK